MAVQRGEGGVFGLDWDVCFCLQLVLRLMMWWKDGGSWIPGPGWDRLLGWLRGQYGDQKVVLGACLTRSLCRYNPASVLCSILSHLWRTSQICPEGAMARQRRDQVSNSDKTSEPIRLGFDQNFSNFLKIICNVSLWILAAIYLFFCSIPSQSIPKGMDLFCLSIHLTLIYERFRHKRGS